MLKRGLILVALLLASAVAVASCENFNTQETAYQALTIFCKLHRADITQILLSQQQQQAGTIVCNAVGLSLGS
jgi:hypothetical protein